MVIEILIMLLLLVANLIMAIKRHDEKKHVATYIHVFTIGFVTSFILFNLL
jgi:hypothetical protein